MRLSILYGFMIFLSMTICSCEKDSAGIKGCTNRRASNYNPLATIEDGTCTRLGSQYDGRFLLKATIFDPSKPPPPDTITYTATLARVSPINNLISLAGFRGVAADTAYFIVNPDGIYFPKMQFQDPFINIYSSADGTYYGNPFLDPTITLNGDTLRLTYQYQEGGSLYVKSASVIGLRIH